MPTSAVKPDALFASTDALADRVRILEGQKEGYVELEGSPDMVLEVVSDSSVRKDTERLRRDYWEAGIREYWLVDARTDPLVLRYYAATRPKATGLPRKKTAGLSRSCLANRSV